MIIKAFYDGKDYEVVLKLLNDMKVEQKDIERVRVRQLFLESLCSVWVFSCGKYNNSFNIFSIFCAYAFDGGIIEKFK